MYLNSFPQGREWPIQESHRGLWLNIQSLDQHAIGLSEDAYCGCSLRTTCNNRTEKIQEVLLEPDRYIILHEVGSFWTMPLPAVEDLHDATKFLMGSHQQPAKAMKGGVEEQLQ